MTYITMADFTFVNDCLMRSPVSSPIRTPRRSNWLRSLARTDTRYLGIDIGIDCVRVATIGAPFQRSSTSPAPSLGWTSQIEFSLPVDSHASPRPDWVDVVSSSLEDRLPRCVDGDRNVALIALPLPWVHYETTTGPEIAKAQQQCDAMFESSIFRSKAHLATWPVSTGRNEQMVAASAESAACQIAEAVTRVGYEVQGILPHGPALLNAAPMLTSLTPTAVLLLETTGGLVAFSSDDTCGLCRNLPACSEAISTTPFLDELRPWLQDVASEVNATSRYVERLSREGDRQSPLMICGRAAHVSGVDATIASMLGRPVATWRYAGRTRPRRLVNVSDPARSDASIAVALSLANCAVQTAAGAKR